MADPKAPEPVFHLLAGDYPLAELRDILGAHGLHIVTEAEKRVLDCMAAVEDIEIDMTLDLRDDLSVRETRVWEAEQARRRTP